MKSPRDHALALLKKAANDLVAARATVATGKALDTVCFHSQQAVEKSLKAILALRDIEYPWRHDLGELLELVKPLAPEVTPFEDRILGMTPFAVEIRYDEEFEPLIDGKRSGDVIARNEVTKQSPPLTAIVPWGLLRFARNDRFRGGLAHSRPLPERLQLTKRMKRCKSLRRFTN